MACKTQVRSFGKADHGVSWALAQLPMGMRVRLLPWPRAKSSDDYVIKVRGPDKDTEWMFLVGAGSASADWIYAYDDKLGGYRMDSVRAAGA